MSDSTISKNLSKGGFSVEYKVKPMDEWEGVDADLIVVDPPFGIEFSGKSGNYNRDESQVVDGYVEWDETQYSKRIEELLEVIRTNLNETGQALVFSGWNNSHIIHKKILESSLNLEGKLYWSYNFAPYCKLRPAHNVYEIYWITKDSDEWYYTNECSYDHCTEGESNLSHIPVKREYHKDMPKYPTRLPQKLVGILVEHFSQEGDLVFDPCAGSGMVGAASVDNNRNAKLGDLNQEGIEVFEEVFEVVVESSDSKDLSDY